MCEVVIKGEKGGKKKEISLHSYYQNLVGFFPQGLNFKPSGRPENKENILILN